MNMQRLSFSLLLFCLTCPTGTFADLYQWTDSTGAIHIVDESVEIPTEFRDSAKVYRATRPSSTGMTPLPLRSFTENTQGSFAQKLARDLGLIKGENEDALSALTGVGISPAGGWKVYDPLSREAAYEVIASARRAAESHRLSLSADGAEGVVRQALGSITLAGAPGEEPPAKRMGYREDEYYDNEPAVVEYVQEVIEVVPEPVYIYSPLVAVTSRHHSHGPRRFRRQPTAPPDASATLPFSSSRFINERSGGPLFSTSSLPLTQPPPFPFASPHSKAFPFASPHPGARR